MSIDNKKEALILFLGDVVVLILSLFLMLFIRYHNILTISIVSDHLLSFSILFAVWLFVYFVAGLYEKHTLILKSRLPSVLLSVEITNILIAIVFFYFIPYFGITPKTNLFVYLVISFGLMLFWRIYGPEFIGFSRKENALLVGEGVEMHELMQEVNNNSRYSLSFVSSIDLNKMESLDFNDEILSRMYSEQIQVVAIDIDNDKVAPILPALYNLIFSHVRFIDMHKIYEDIFDRVPLSLLKHSWFIENISLAPKFGYDVFKRLMDIAISIFLGLVTLVLYPFVYIAIKLDDGGSVLYTQERVGRNNHVFRIYKFRTMSEDGEPKMVTAVGHILRKLRIDEFPQIWNVLTGDMSLIGPRPEMPHYVQLYETEIPYFNIRHLIKPGLSGWAQIYHIDPPKFKPGAPEARKKLSYDLYYIKNRSLMLDVKIALKTLKTLISTSGV